MPHDQATTSLPALARRSSALLFRTWQSGNNERIKPLRRPRVKSGSMLWNQGDNDEVDILIAMVSGLFLVSASGLCAGDLPGAPEGWAATPSLHLKGQGGPVKNMQPDLITGYGYRPAQIKAAYGINGTGAGQTIAIVDAYGSPTIEEDLSAFCRTYKLPQATLQVHYKGTTGSDANWALETSLDVEWAHALAPGAVIVACSSSIRQRYRFVCRRPVCGGTACPRSSA